MKSWTIKFTHEGKEHRWKMVNEEPVFYTKAGKPYKRNASKPQVAAYMAHKKIVKDSLYRPSPVLPGDQAAREERRTKRRGMRRK